MLIQAVKSKIHRVRVTQAELNYVGSITIDEVLMEAANLVEGEKVQVVNINNGERLETYIVIIIGYGYMTMDEARGFTPSLVFPEEGTNRLI
jgi:aspartate 1-decarboxylase